MFLLRSHRPVLSVLLLQRKSEGEHESSRRLKTQFLIEMEGFDSGNEQILLIGNDELELLFNLINGFH